MFGDSLPDQDQDGDGIPFNLSMRFPGQRYDAASGLNQNGARDYNAGGGRYVESDPIGLRGGMSTYGYVGGDPLHFIDPLGLLRWTNQGTTTMHNFDPSNPPAPSPFYSGGNVPENAGATVSADWKIRPKCVPRGGVFVLEEYEVDFQTFIHLMPSYPSQRLASWAVRAERDHITDYDNWASGRGQGTAQAVEDKIRTLTFDSLCECEQTADATMHNNLGPSFDKVIQETRAKHDATGRHLWGGPNARK